MKPYSESCEQNREPILAVLQQWLPGQGRLLEIGSGTGQHAAYFAPEFPDLQWQTSDRAANHAGIRAWLAEAPANVRPPLELDVNQAPWPVGEVEVIYSANTAHIMGWSAVEALFAGVGRHLLPGGLFLLYGPFNYGGRYTSESNERFDAWLKARDPESGIRDFEALEALAAAAGLALECDQPMPANNRTLVWRRE